MSYVANLDDVIVTSSGLSQLGLGDCRFNTESLCYKLGVWCLKEFSVQQAGRVQHVGKRNGNTKCRI